MKEYGEKGITLIALVVTIVVLLILASVTIAMKMQNNNVFSRANDAKSKTRIATLKEETAMWEASKTIDSVANSTSETKDQFLDRLVSEGKITEAEKTQLKETGTLDIDGEKYSMETDCYAVLYENGDLVISHSQANTTDVGQTVKKDYGSISDSDYAPWMDTSTYKSAATKIIIKDKVAPTSAEYWFSGVTSIEGLQNLNTSCVTNMERMFYGYKGTAIDISSFDTSKVTSMMYAFGNCPNLTNISGIENLNTSNVEKIDGLFCLDAKITSLNLSKWDVSKVSSVGDSYWKTENGELSLFTEVGVFDGCKALVDLNVSNWNLINATNLTKMFGECSNLKDLNLTGFKIANATSTLGMFSGDSMLTNLDLSGFNTSKTNEFDYMFSGCTGLTNLDLSNFDVSSITDMIDMFEGCTNLKTINFTGWDSKIRSDAKMTDMFKNCPVTKPSWYK